MDEPSLWARVLGRVVYEFAEIQPMLPTYGHLIISALFPIYAGAHASLARPSSAAKPPKKKRKSKSKSDDSVNEDSSDDDEEEEDEQGQKMEGLSPSDAIIMPLLAGATLAGLYFLIKWLEDPAILNKALNAYFALFGVFSVSKLITDALDFGHSVIFPRRFALGSALYRVDQEKRRALSVVGDTKATQDLMSPLPGILAIVPLPAGLQSMLWADRAMPHQKWTARLYVHHLVAGKVLVGPHGIFGIVVAVLAILYFNFVDKPWYLTNLLGFGFSYSALQLMSPTTFATGSLILCALFFYDIYFVFYTPMMVTVAKSLDVPIKLVFPRPSSTTDPAKRDHAMLGLGDVVLPGIMIGLALRFDFFIFYLRRQARKPAADGPGVVEKAVYHPLTGRWSDHFWTHSWTGRPLWSTTDSRTEPPFTFPKTYFMASLFGYTLGMLTTLGAMHFWGHAQPALLYLVPGVLGSLWLTAWIKGELDLMWNYNEAEEEVADSEKKDGEASKAKDEALTGRTSFFSLSEKKTKDREDRLKKSLLKQVQVDDVEGSGEKSAASELDDEKSQVIDKAKPKKSRRHSREIFSFSIEAPLKPKHSGPETGEGGSDKSEAASAQSKFNGEDRTMLEKDEPTWAPTGDNDTVPQAGKRVRLS